MIGKNQRCRTRTAFATIDRKEIDAAIAALHQLHEVMPKIQLTDRGLDADRDARKISNTFNEIQHLVGV